MKIYSIYDSKAEAYLPLNFFPTKAAAIRSFSAAAQDPKSDFHKFAQDFTLFELGEWDEQTAKFVIHEAKIPLGTAVEYSNPITNGEGP